MNLNIAILSTACLFGSFATVRADHDENIPFSQAPAAVQQTIKGTGATVIKVEKATEDGKLQYEVKTMNGNGKIVEYVVKPDGSLDSTEEKTSLESLPGGVAGAAKMAVGDGTIRNVEKVTKAGNVTYEVGYKTTKGDKNEAVITPGGKVISNGLDND